MLAFENQMSYIEKYLFLMVKDVAIAKRLAAIAIEYSKPNYGKWNNNT